MSMDWLKIWRREKTAADQAVADGQGGYERAVMAGDAETAAIEHELLQGAQQWQQKAGKRLKKAEVRSKENGGR
jgi:hypothetical protein